MLAIDILQDGGFAWSETPQADASWVIMGRRQEGIGALLTDIPTCPATRTFSLAEWFVNSWSGIGSVMTSGVRRKDGRPAGPEFGTLPEQAVSPGQSPAGDHDGDARGPTEAMGTA